MTSALSPSRYALQTLRQRAVKAVQDGTSVALVARSYGVSERSVFRWLASYAQQGPQGLLARQIPGRPPIRGTQ